MRHQHQPFSYLKFSFTLTYILLLTTGLITFIEALRTENENVRHVMNLETCISVVAAYFYGVFLQQIHNRPNSSSINYKLISQTRYTDWCITTPMMLLCLCIVLGMHTEEHLKLQDFLIIIFLNYAMLLTGYLGEIGVLKPFTACLLGFIPFKLMFAYIYYRFVEPKYIKANYILFLIYFFVWSFYGAVYLLDNVYKNIGYNTLDCIAKCLIGLGLWAYYTKIIIL